MAPPTREELDAQAVALGLDPSSMDTKGEVEAAIAEAEAAAGDDPSRLDEDGSDDSGRPPLAQVAEERHNDGPRVREITTPEVDA